MSRSHGIWFGPASSQVHQIRFRRGEKSAQGVVYYKIKRHYFDFGNFKISRSKANRVSILLSFIVALEIGFWDFGKTQQGGVFKRIGALNRPPTELLTALTKLEKEHAMKGSKIPQYIEELKKNWPKLAPKYTRYTSLKDVLFRADYNHFPNPDICNIDTPNNAVQESEEEYDDEEEQGGRCINCDQTKIIRRKPRDMRVHYGLIASGNQVIKDATFRDEINARLDGKVLCFEVEAAGLMNEFPCIVIRGICDYADSHKNKEWQEHAAAVAAAFAKEILLLVPAQEVEQMPVSKVRRHQPSKLCLVFSYRP
jgi:hypothetical protein